MVLYTTKVSITCFISITRMDANGETCTGACCQQGSDTLERAGDVLYPDEMGTMFSGSGVVDTYNTSGLKCGAEDPIVLFYTAAGGTSIQSTGHPFTQCIAYSIDGGVPGQNIMIIRSLGR